jgi:ERCC4-type nuclease
MPAGDESGEQSADLSAEAGNEAAATVEASDEASTEAAGGGEVREDAPAETPVPYTLPGIGEKTVRKLVDGGFPTLEALTTATAEVLSELPGIGGKTAEKILAAVRGEEAQAEGDI